jgi:hypothetical protein
LPAGEGRYGLAEPLLGMRRERAAYRGDISRIRPNLVLIAVT